MYDKITKFMSYVVVVCVIIAAIFGAGFMVVIGLRGATGAWIILALLILCFFTYGMAFYFRSKRIKKQNQIREEQENIKENKEIVVEKEDIIIENKEV